MPLRILLADDHAIVRQGFRALLERAGFEVIGEAENGQQAIELAGKLHPDIAVLDVTMPILNGIDASRAIRKVSDRTQIILLTMHSHKKFVMESLRAGVQGYVIKSAAANELLHAIRTVCKGNPYLTPEVAKVMVDGYLQGGDGQADSLGDRERQVLQLVAEGKTSKEVADVLGITVKTAESHRAHLMEKLQIHDTAGLVRYAIREGLVQL
jgi:two-component system, NarL family, response regulator NreC